MPTVLIVSPNFPPINAADMQRVRMSLPHFEAFGWRPVVLAVEAEYVERVRERLLLETVPDGVPVCRTRALPARLTRRVGVGDLALRALPFFYRAGVRLIRQHDVDLVYFSTTAFPILTLGRVWKAQESVPFVVDMQDPWLSDYYEDKPPDERPPKYRWAQLMHRTLEPWTMRRVDGVIAVTAAYHETLRQRYPWIREALCRTIPFGAAERDYEVAAGMAWSNPYFNKEDGHLHGVYAGVLGKSMEKTCRGICMALRKGLQEWPECFSRVRLHFVGTSYAEGGRARETIAPIAREMGVEQFMQEETQRISYFAVLRMLKEADFLLVPGSDNPQYTASKIYPYILARKPLLTVFHKESSLVEVVQRTRSGTVVPFETESCPEEIGEALVRPWRHLLGRLPYEPETDWEAFSPYTAREMARRQCKLFDDVMAARRAGRTDALA